MTISLVSTVGRSSVGTIGDSLIFQDPLFALLFRIALRGLVKAENTDRTVGAGRNSPAAPRTKIGSTKEDTGEKNATSFPR